MEEEFETGLQDRQDRNPKHHNPRKGAIMRHEELTKKNIGCAYTVYNKMGFGFLESVYEKCMLIELEKAGLKVEAQCPIHVFYDGDPVGEFFADVLVEKTIILELKSVRRIVQAHEVQLVNYRTATQKEVGLVLNFGPEKVEVKRKVRCLNEPGSNPVDPVILSKKYP